MTCSCPACRHETHQPLPKWWHRAVDDGLRRKVFFGTLVVLAQSSIAVVSMTLIFLGHLTLGLLLIIWGVVQARGLLELGWRRPRRRMARS